MKEQMNKQEQVNEVNTVYERPTMEVIEMEMEGSILAASDFNPGGGKPW